MIALGDIPSKRDAIQLWGWEATGFMWFLGTLEAGNQPHALDTLALCLGLSRGRYQVRIQLGHRPG